MIKDYKEWEKEDLIELAKFNFTDSYNVIDRKRILSDLYDLKKVGETALPMKFITKYYKSR